MNINKTATLLRFFILLILYSLRISSFAQDSSIQIANKKIIARYFDEVVNTQQLSRMDNFFSQDYIWHQMNGKTTKSSEDSSHASTLKFIFNAIPDIKYTIDNLVSDGDMVAVNSTVTGTANGQFFGYPASNKKVYFKQMFFFRLVNNKIKEEWEVIDIAGIKEQLSK